MRTIRILISLISTPTAAFGQAAIAGAVTDPSGAAVSAVAVEATSDALIENTRTTMTDGAGRYRIEDLRPGIYRVRFTHPGWRSYQLNGVELTGSLTAIVDAQLAVGPLTETIAVTGEPPAVDVQSGKRAVTLTGDVIRLLPAARSYNALLALVPGIVTNVNDTVIGPSATSFPIHGGRQQEGRLLLDGLTVGSPPAATRPRSTTWTRDRRRK